MRRIFVLLTSLFALSGFAFSDVNFRVRPNPAAKTFGIRMEITNASDVEKVSIPAWCPGFYFLLDYEKSIFDVNATTPEGAKLTVKKVGARSWEVQNPAKTPVTVTYRLQAADSGLGFFRTHLRASSGFMNGPASFLYAEKHMNDRHTLKVVLPEGWNLATAMDRDDEGNLFAGGYDEFIDHPIQLGRFVSRKFTLQNIPFEVVWVADPGPLCNVDEETERIKIGSLPALKMMGGAPFKRYLYIIHLEVGDFAGGLEHRASTQIAVPNQREVHLDALATHEYFHSWNVKQIRPAVLGPFDYSKEQRCPNLWFSEGVTDYYAHRHAYQAGLLTESQYLAEVQSQIEELQRSKVRLQMTIEDVCRNTWENGGFGVGDLSYYTHGFVSGLIFDATIRANTAGQKSLDDVMRAAMSRYALPKPGFGDNDLRGLMVEFGGESMGPLYDRMIRSKQEFPYELLKGIGLRLASPDKPFLELPFVLNEKNEIVKVPKSEGVGPKEGDVFVSGKEIGNGQIEVMLKRGDNTIAMIVKGRESRFADYRLTRDRLAPSEAQTRLREWLAIPH